MGLDCVWTHFPNHSLCGIHHRPKSLPLLGKSVCFHVCSQICLTRPTNYIQARSPGSVATHEVPELSDEELLIQQEQYRTALVRLAPEEFVEETLCNGGDTS